LAQIARDYAPLAPIQHGLLLVVILIWAFLREKVGYVLRLYLILLLASVAFAGWMHGNILNGVVFSLLALVGVYELFSRRMDLSLQGKPIYNIIIAIIGGAVGFYYPYFVDSYWRAIWESPLGFIPSPTLLVVLSVFLLTIPRTNRVWHWFLVATGLFYSIVNIIYLKIYLDYILLALSLYSFNVLVLVRQKSDH